MNERYSIEDYKQLLTNATDRQLSAQLGRWRADFVAEETPKIMAETGLAHKNRVQITSPFRNEKNPSFSMANSKDGSFVFHDFGSSELSGAGAVQFRYIQMFGHKPTREDEERFLIDEGLNRNYEQLLLSSISEENNRNYKDPQKEYRLKQIKLFEFLQDNGFISLTQPQGFPEKDYIKKVEFDLNAIKQIYPNKEMLSKALAGILQSDSTDTKFSERDNNQLAYALSSLAFNEKPVAYFAVFDEHLRVHNLHNAANGMLEIPLHKFDKGTSLVPLNFDSYLRDKAEYNIGDGSKTYHDRKHNAIVRHKELNELDKGELLVTADVYHFRDAIKEGVPAALIPRGFYDENRGQPKYVFNVENDSVPLSKIMSSVFSQSYIGKVQLDLNFKEHLSLGEHNVMLSNMKQDLSKLPENQVSFVLQNKQHLQWLSVALSQMPKDRDLNVYRFNTKQSNDLVSYFLNMYPVNDAQIQRKTFNFLMNLNGVTQYAQGLANKNLELSERYLASEGLEKKRLESQGAQRNYKEIYQNVVEVVNSVSSLSRVYTDMFDKDKRSTYQANLWDLSPQKTVSIDPVIRPVGVKPQYAPPQQLLLNANQLAAEIFQTKRETKEYKDFVDSRHLKKFDSQGVRIDEKFNLGYADGDEFNQAFKQLTGRNLNVSYNSKENLQGHGQYFTHDGEKKGMFVERITFPVKDEFGQVVAFGARRTKDDGTAKYINSKTPEETKAIFNKNQVFYGLFESKNAIQSSNEIVITEGYMDCIASHVAGVENAVATMGTGLGVEKLLKAAQYADSIKIVLDGDRAGLKAMDESVLPSVLKQKVEGLPIVYSPDKQISFVNLPYGLDPDECINQFGSDDYKKRLENSIPVEDYAIIATYRAVFLVNKNYEPLPANEQIQRQSDPIYQAQFKQQLDSLLSDVKDFYPDVASKTLIKADLIVESFNAVKGMSINSDIGKSFEQLNSIFMREQKQEFENPFKQVLFPVVAQEMQENFLKKSAEAKVEKNEIIDNSLSEKALAMVREALEYKEENKQVLVNESTFKMKM